MWLEVKITKLSEDPGARIIGCETDGNFATVDTTEVHCIPHDRIVKVVRVVSAPGSRTTLKSCYMNKKSVSSVLSVTIHRYTLPDRTTYTMEMERMGTCRIIARHIDLDSLTPLYGVYRSLRKQVMSIPHSAQNLKQDWDSRRNKRGVIYGKVSKLVEAKF
jgi:hypothetical protein